MSLVPQAIPINDQQRLHYRLLLIVTMALTCASLLVDGSSMVLSLIANTLIITNGVAGWFSADADPWVQRPAVTATGLLIIQALLSMTSVWLGVPLLAILAQPGISVLILACLMTAVLALTIASEYHKYRPGGRALLRARRYYRVASGAALTSWLLLLLHPAMAGRYLETDRVYQGLLLLNSLLVALLLWQTWRARSHDRLLMSVAGLTGGLLLAHVSTEVVALFLVLPPSADGLHLITLTGLWCVLVAMSVLSLRRPVPPLPLLDEATIKPQASRNPETEATEAMAKQPSLVADYISLTKPRVLSLLLLTTLASMFITGEGSPSFSLILWTLLGGYLAAGGAGAINCAFDSDIDLLMGRTGRRPVPSGRISRHNALLFGLVLSLLAFVVLATFTTLLAAALSMVGVVYYAFVYTCLLKRHTWQNIVIGGGAGALPPLVGWAAVAGSLSLPAIVLFMIVFYWTPPHFWALALVKEKDYARAGVPMLPVVAGEHETRWQIFLYSCLMVAVTLLLTPLQAMGWIYLLLALLLGGLFLRYAWNVWRVGGQAHTWGLYKFSLLYLALLFVAMVVDRVVLG